MHRTTASPCHRVSQSFALPPATKPVSHLPCPLPPNQSVISLAPYHRVTMSPHHCVTAPPRHRISQSFALPPATKPVSHLPCPLPPNQSVICLAPYHCITVPPHHRVTATALVSHLPCPLPPSQSVICLAPATKPVSHLPCPLPPNQSVICLAPCHQTSQSFALPPTTASPCHRITVSPCHRITALVSHLPCPLPPSQSVICLAPCHQTSQSFALPPTTTSPHHRITVPPRHHVSQSFALPPATKPVSHLPCPLPPNQSVISLAPYHRVTAPPCHCITVSLHHHVTASPH